MLVWRLGKRTVLHREISVRVRYMVSSFFFARKNSRVKFFENVFLKGDKKMFQKYTPNLKQFKKSKIKAARELLYSPEVIAKIEAAKTHEEVYRILINARKEDD